MALIEIIPFLMVIAIVAIVTFGKTVRARDKLRADAQLNAPSDDAVRLAREVNRLNERIQVLERLATDPAKRLSAEIDALDDTKR